MATGFFLGGKKVMECSYPLTSIRAEVKNDWNYTSTPLPHALMTWAEKNFSFYLPLCARLTGYYAFHMLNRSCHFVSFSSSFLFLLSFFLLSFHPFYLSLSDVSCLFVPLFLSPFVSSVLATAWWGLKWQSDPLLLTRMEPDLSQSVKCW